MATAASAILCFSCPPVGFCAGKVFGYIGVRSTTMLHVVHVSKKCQSLTLAVFLSVNNSLCNNSSETNKEVTFARFC